MASSDNTTFISAKTGDNVEITMKHKRRTYISGTLVGEINRDPKKSDGYPFVNILLNLNKSESWFFSVLYSELEKRRNKSDLTIEIVSHKLTPAEKNKRVRATKGLIRKKLIKKTGRNSYMVNPEALVHYDSHEANMIKWEAIK